jgi:aryl-alcohol dehydrogenase-like predicted oxidoreductase
MRDFIQLSPLGFGCAPIMGKIGKSQSLRAMNLAFDLGVTHFDVARSYGFGRAEQVVGEFLKSRRDKATLTSKFGVVPPSLSLRTRTMIPIARTVANVFPQLKLKLKKKSGQLLAERRFDAAFAQQCLNQSLSELATDYIDIYLIHEPDAALLSNSDEIVTFLEKSVINGKIRRWGFAYGSIEDYAWASLVGGDVIQFEGNIGTLPSCGPLLVDERQRLITRPFMGGLDGNPALETFVQDLKLSPVLRELGVSLADISLCLAHHIAGRSGSVLCSMFSSEHIRNNVRAINELSNDARMIHIIDEILKSKVS